MTTFTAKNFSIENGTLSGPADYMTERGNAKIDEILAGKIPSFSIFLENTPTVEQALVVWLQTDYAAYLGDKQLAGWLSK